jgi:hypothetical protein
MPRRRSGRRVALQGGRLGTWAMGQPEVRLAHGYLGEPVPEPPPYSRDPDAV